MNTVSQTGDPTDPLFRWLSDVLGEQDPSVVDLIYAILFQEASAHIDYLREHLDPFFWIHVDPDEIDVLIPGKSPYNMVLQKLGIRSSGSIEDHEFRLRIFTINPKAAELMNFILHFLIGELRKHHPQPAQ